LSFSRVMPCRAGAFQSYILISSSSSLIFQ
jgi:hypothetical protein